MSYDRNRTPPARPVVPPSPPMPAYPPRPPQRGESWSPGNFSPAIFLVAALVIGTLVGVALLSRQGSEAPAAGPAATGAPLTATAAPARTYIVANTGGDGVYLRKTPDLADRDKAYPEGTALVAIGPDTTANGEIWHNVRAPDGRTGWVPARYTADAPGR